MSFYHAIPKRRSLGTLRRRGWGDLAPLDPSLVIPVPLEISVLGLPAFLTPNPHQGPEAPASCGN